MTNSIFEFSESLQEVGTCLLDKTVTDANGECGRVLRWHKAELGGDRRPIYCGELRHKTRRQRHACWGCFGKSLQPLTQQLLLDEVGVLREVVLPKLPNLTGRSLWPKLRRSTLCMLRLAGPTVIRLPISPTKHSLPLPLHQLQNIIIIHVWCFFGELQSLTPKPIIIFIYVFEQSGIM
uniref:Uncharacterized protein n=1 Tax=Helianthus annuus TaxID=4232 RepID=A0A251V4L7_HELAN